MATSKVNAEDRLTFDQSNPTELNFSKEQVQRIRERLAHEKVNFFFIPSARLRELTVQGMHPHVQQFPKSIKTGILLGNTIALKREVVFQFLEKELGEPWSFMLSRGEIRARQDKLFSFKNLANNDS